MSIGSELMEVLSDGAVHSGAALAQRFGMSRAAIWKRVAQLRSQGVAVDAVAGRGYRLMQPWSRLDRERVLQNLLPATRSALGSLGVVATTGSTNDDLRASASHLPDLSVLAAEHQTHGRGRRGRAWLSPFGAGLWFSVLARNENGVGQLAGLSLAIAVLVAEALENAGVARVGLKWPNDVIVGHRKLGGILIDLAGDWHGPSTAVIGIGINVALPQESRAAIVRPTVDLAEALGRVPDRNLVLALLLDSLLPGLMLFRGEGLPAFVHRWEARDALRGYPVRMDSGVSGIAEGIDPEGRLRVRTGDASVSIGVGEVSVVRDDRNVG